MCPQDKKVLEVLEFSAQVVSLQMRNTAVAYTIAVLFMLVADIQFGNL